jgi:Zn-dependent protease with chaperone function
MTDRQSSGHARYNPFAFPSDVDFAFGLLIVLVLGVSLTIFVAIANDIGPVGLPDQQVAEAAGLSHRPEGTVAAGCEALQGPLSEHDSLQYELQWDTAFNVCMSAFRTPAGPVVTGLALLVVLAVAIYVLYPVWKVRRRHLVPLTVSDSPEVVEELRSLTRLSGLAREPRYVWDPLDMACGGLAFGLPGRRYVALTGGLVTKLWTDRDVFRAVMLHELAHLRNRDVDKAYATVAVWWSFVVTALLPFTVLVLFAAHPPPLVVARRVLSLAAIALVVYLVRNAALRAREVYADVRASAWPPFAGTLDRVLSSSRASGEHPYVGRALRWLSLHPSTTTRTETVRDTASLFTTSFWFAAGAGAAGSLALIGGQAIVGSIPSIGTWVGDWVSPALFGSLVVGIAGVTVWRAAFLADLRGESVPGQWRVGVGVAAGVGAGGLLALAETTVFPAGFGLTGSALVIFEVWWYALLFAASVVFFRWVLACASTWLPVAAASDSPRRALVVGLIPAALVATGGLWFLFYIRGDASTGGLGLSASEPPLLTNELNDVAFLKYQSMYSPFFYVCVQLLWAVPIAAWLFRRRAAPVATARWALLDRGRGGLSGSPPPRLRPGFAALAGLVGGLGFGVVTIAASLVLTMASARPAVVAWQETGQVFAGVLVQTAVAAAVAARVRHLGVVHGLLAAFVCGAVTSLAALGADVLTNGFAVLDLRHSLVPVTVSNYLNASLLVTLPAAGCAAGLASWARRTEARPRRPLLRLVAIVGALLFALIGAQVAAQDTAPTAAAPSGANGAVVYDDTFNSDTGWAPYQSGAFLTALEPGALHASLQSPNVFGGQYAPGISEHPRIRIDATMAVTGGEGAIGVECSSTGAGTYDFWVNTQGTAALILRQPHDRDKGAILTRTAVPLSWDPSRRHRLTAICTGSPNDMRLDLLVDGAGILTTRDHQHNGSFRPAYLLESGPTRLEVDIVEFTVTALP